MLTPSNRSAFPSFDVFKAFPKSVIFKGKGKSKVVPVL
jgi:hypothetical protein